MLEPLNERTQSRWITSPTETQRQRIRKCDDVIVGLCSGVFSRCFGRTLESSCPPGAKIGCICRVHSDILRKGADCVGTCFTRSHDCIKLAAVSQFVNFNELYTMPRTKHWASCYLHALVVWSILYHDRKDCRYLKGSCMLICTRAGSCQ